MKLHTRQLKSRLVNVAFMGQYFQIINLDKQQTTGFVGKWLEISDDCGVLWLITRPYIPTLAELYETSDLFKSTVIGNENLGAFTKLPTEVVDLIFQALPSKAVLGFALTNSQILSIGYRILRQKLVEANAPWCGGRLICLGDEGTGLPQGFLSAGEARSLGLGNFARDEENDNCSLGGNNDNHKPAGTNHGEGGVDEDGSYDEDDINYKLYQLAYTSFRRGNGSEMSEFWSLRSRITSKSERRRYSAIINAPRRSKSQVLINTSKKEYIRKIEGLYFGFAFPQLIVWGYDDERGPWAGDRLMVVSTEDFAGCTNQEEGWVDVTRMGIRMQSEFIRRRSYLLERLEDPCILHDDCGGTI